MSTRQSSSLALLLAALWALLGAPPAGAGPARDYLRFTEAMIFQARGQMPAYTRAAEAAAERVVGGGELYLAGSDRGFLAEALGRAGGLMLARPLPAPEKATGADVVLVAPSPGEPSADAALCRQLRQAGALVVAFGAGADFPAEHAFPCLAAPGDGLFTGPDGKRLCPTDTVSDVVQLWAWTGEFVAACTRRGRMPAMWQSVMVPGARERNEPLHNLKFHPEGRVRPIPPGRLGREYLRGLGLCLRRLREKGLRDLERIAVDVRRTRDDGHTNWLWIMGHLPPHVVGIGSEAGLFRALPTTLPAAPGIGAADLVLALGYTGLDPRLLEEVSRAGARAAWIIAPVGAPDAARRRGDRVVDQQWRLGDALVRVPGYDVAILPPSAVTQLACYWAIVGETLAAGPRR